MYSLLVLLSALSLLALVRALASPTGRRLLVWGLVSAAALATHYFATFVLIPEAACLLIALHRRGTLSASRVGLSCGPIVVVAAALSPLAIHQDDGRASWISNQAGSLAYRLAQLVKQDIIGDGQPHKTLLGLIGGLLVLLAVVLLLARGNHGERLGALPPIIVGVGGVCVAVIVAAAGSDYFDTRNMLATWPALALVAAAGLGAARAGRLGLVGAAGLTVLSVFCVSNIVRDPAFQRDDWRGAVHALGATSRPRALVADLYHALPPLQTYTHGLGGYPTAGAPVEEVDVIWLERKGYGRPIIPVAPLTLPGFEAQELRTSSYIVFRYRASKPTVYPATTLDRIYPRRKSGADVVAAAVTWRARPLRDRHKSLQQRLVSVSDAERVLPAVEVAAVALER